MALELQLTARCYTIDLDEEAFAHLMNAESPWVRETLPRKDARSLGLQIQVIPGVSMEYEQAFGNILFLTISEDHDTEEARSRVAEMVEAHLAWCATLPRPEPRSQNP